MTKVKNLPSDFINNETLKHAKKVPTDHEFVEEMTRHNYELGKQFYPYTVLERQLHMLLHTCFSREHLKNDVPPIE